MFFLEDSPHYEAFLCPWCPGIIAVNSNMIIPIKAELLVMLDCRADLTVGVCVVMNHRLYNVSAHPL